jgi:hypothetical protein
MSERDTIEKVKQRQGVLAKIENLFGFGYATKEDLRELDKKLRDSYYADFKSLRHKWEEIYLTAVNAGLKKAGDDFKKVIQVMDRVAEKIHRADYGYAGLMDRKGSIKEAALAKVFDYDRALSNDIRGLIGSVDELYSDSEAERWADVTAKVGDVKSLILGFESKWDGREKEFRPLEV